MTCDYNTKLWPSFTLCQDHLTQSNKVWNLQSNHEARWWAPFGRLRKSRNILKKILNSWATSIFYKQVINGCSIRNHLRLQNYGLQILRCIIHGKKHNLHQCKKNPWWEDFGKYNCTWIDSSKISISESW